MMWFFIISLMLLLSIVCFVSYFCETYNAVINVLGISCICILIAFVIYYIAFFPDNSKKQSIADKYEQLVNPPSSLESRVDNLRKCMERCTNQKDFHDVERTIEIVENFEKDYKTKIDVNSLVEKVTPERHCKNSTYEYVIHRNGNHLALESIMRCCGICAVRREEIAIH